MSRYLVLLAMPLVAGAACGSPEPPLRPSWTEDVEPILRGSCGHCHGATASATGMKYRFDICSPEAPMVKDLGITFAGFTGAADQALAELILLDVTSQGGARPKMPPPPAELLDSYQVEVLRRWADRVKKNPDPLSLCNTRRGNQTPTVTLVSAAERKGENLEVTIDVSDADGETVVGKAQAGTETVPILGPGRHTLKFPGVDEGEKVTVTVTDGSRTKVETLE